MDHEGFFRVVLVDDEDLSRQAVASLIDWEGTGFTLAGQFANGLEAWKCLETLRPHFVITDIKMPVMDGLELVARAHLGFPEIQFVVLSGYAEFEYAIQAMRNGVRHYLLKPCNEKVILESLLNLRSQQEKTNPSESRPVVRGQENEIVASIVAWVTNHLEDRGLTLQKIGEKFLFMNPDYLGRLFQKTTGEKFNDYLLRRRIETAMRLMQENPSLPLCQLALKVGYSDDGQYFSKSFKRYAGYSFSEYRQRIVESGASPSP